MYTRELWYKPLHFLLDNCILIHNNIMLILLALYYKGHLITERLLDLKVLISIFYYENPELCIICLLVYCQVCPQLAPLLRSRKCLVPRFGGGWWEGGEGRGGGMWGRRRGGEVKYIWGWLAFPNINQKISSSA